MVISKTRFNRLPTKPTSVSRRLNPTKMKCNPGNFQCGASCKPIRNKRTGKDTNCKANVPLGMARTGLMWLKDREDRVSQLNTVRQQRRASGKPGNRDLVLDKKTGRLSPQPKTASDITPQEAAWQSYLSAAGYSQSQFDQLPLKQKGRMKGAFARQEKEVAMAIAKQQREEARNAAIREEVKTMESVKIPNHFKVQKETPKGDGTSDYLIEARHSVINGKPNKYGSLIYAINAPSGENAQQIFKRAIANAKENNSVIALEDQVAVTPSKLTNQITVIPTEKTGNRKPRSTAPRKDPGIVEQPTRAAIQTPKLKPKQGVTDRQYTGKATSKQDGLDSIIVGEMFNASGHDASDSVYLWIEGMRDSNPQAAKMVESVANAVADADPRWILDNQKLLTVSAFKKNYPAIAKALNVALPKTQVVEKTLGETKPPRSGTPAQVEWADNIVDKLLDPLNRSGVNSTQNWLKKMKADGQGKRAEQIERVLKFIEKKDAKWLINNKDRLTPKSFRDNHEMYAIQFGVIPPLPAANKLTFDQLNKEARRLRQPGAGNQQRLKFIEDEMKRRSESDFSERFRYRHRRRSA